MYPPWKNKWRYLEQIINILNFRKKMSDYRKQQVEHLDSMKDNYSKKKKKKKALQYITWWKKDLGWPWKRWTFWNWKQAYILCVKKKNTEAKADLYSVCKEEEYRGKEEGQLLCINLKLLKIYRERVPVQGQRFQHFL